MKRILVGIDGHPASRVAAAWAAAQAAASGAELVAVHARDEHEPVGTSRQLLARWCAPAAALGVPIDVRTATGDPVGTLLTLASSLDVDLVVLGRRGPPEPGGERVGSVVEGVACCTARPVAVVPVEAGVGAVGRILVGVDGTPGSDAAVGFAAQLAVDLSASVMAVDAFDPHATTSTDPARANWHTERLRQLEHAWTGALHDLDVRSFTMLVADNHVADVLLGAAKQYSIELLVVGLAHRGSPARRSLGGADLALLHQLELPTVLVPVPD